jgi:hypothetical protein
MTRRIYQNGFADGGIVPIGIHNVSSFPKAPDESKKRVLNSFPSMHIGAMELQRMANEQLKSKKSKDLTSILSFMNKHC